MFAVQNVSPRIGVITAILQEKQHTEDLERTSIELADCKEFMPGGLHEGKSNNYLFDIERIVSTNNDQFLCPIDIETLAIQGIYGKKVFKYVKIELQGCNLAQDECASEIEIAKQQVSLEFLRSAANIRGENQNEVVEYLHDT